MKSKYETVVEPNLGRISDWCRDGVSDKDIAKRLGVAYSTFRVYRDKYPALSATLERTKDIVDSEVVNAGYKRATGYYVDEWEELYDGQGNLLSRKKKQKYIPPDPRMVEWWLNYRQRNLWGAAVEATDSDTGGVIMISQRNIVEMPKGGDDSSAG